MPTDDALSAADIPATPSMKRAEAVQRLQIGLAGLATMVLLIALASVIMQGAQQSQSGTSDGTLPATVAEQPAAKKNDPLAEAGVVPDLPVQEGAAPPQEPAIMPEQGNGAATP
ncbi:MAG: hypothetical protein ACK4GD_07985 [Sphingomonadaceae bacterium]